MNRLILIIFLFVIFVIPNASAATSPYPNPYRQTMWNNLTDGIHTLGQSPQQARLTKFKLHGARAKARLTSIQKAEWAQHKAKMQAWQNSQSS